jgi:hypothetical protein
MRARAAIAVLASSIAASCGDSATVELECPRSPVQSAEALDSSAELHWTLAGDCIETSYDPALEEIRPEIEAAFAAWSGIECGRLCILPPVARAVPRRSRSMQVS